MYHNIYYEEVQICFSDSQKLFIIHNGKSTQTICLGFQPGIPNYQNIVHSLKYSGSTNINIEQIFNFVPKENFFNSWRRIVFHYLFQMLVFS